jgi:hypothetical protein
MSLKDGCVLQLAASLHWAEGGARLPPTRAALG